jgi:hypothetical protein
MQINRICRKLFALILNEKRDMSATKEIEGSVNLTWRSEQVYRPKSYNWWFEFYVYSECLALNDWMTAQNDLEKMWTESAEALFEVSPRYLNWEIKDNHESS